ncbi:MAG: hypothetical protein CFH32_00281 [Alphaproteobacteria bacterium MarineAlpha9_Bin2]|nr:MAG: hypothetical protein CFH32_00281 [Alphaproteobacteria bacterium MarineAlpha9_Bin2]
MNSPIRFIQRMVVFIVVTSLIGAFLVHSLLDAFYTNPMLNGLIIFVLFFGIVVIFRQVFTLKPEISWVESYKRSQTKGLTSSVNNHKLVLLAPMSSMLEEHKGRPAMSSIAMRSLLDSLNLRLDESREISRYMISLLVFLGLLGTFWGLLITIGSVGSVISSLGINDDDATTMFLTLKEGLKEPLNGMGTAFSSSLFGLSGSLILGFLDLQASQAQNQFYNDVEEWLSSMSLISTSRASTSKLLASEEEGVPVYVQALLEQTAESVDALQRTMGRGEDERKNIADNFANLAEKMGAVADQIKNNQKLLSNFSGGIDDATKDHIRNLDISMGRLIEESKQGNKQLIYELRSEIKILAKTVAMALDTSVSGKKLSTSTKISEEKTRSKPISAKKE